jgi:glycosyltransferase involved in cell wall biosynthesis
MHVLQVIDTLMHGGAQRLLVTFAQQAQERGVNTTVLSLSNKGGAPLLSDLEAHGARVVVLASRRLFDPKGFWQALQLIRAGPFDVVHTHLTYANINGGLAARLSGLPVVASIHNTAVDARHSHPLRDRLELWVMRHVDRRVLAVGESVAGAYGALLRRAIDVIPNAVPLSTLPTPEERAVLRAGLAVDPLCPLCIAVGRFSHQKGYSDLLDAFAKVHRRSPRTVLAVVGDGLLRNEIEEKVAALGLGSHVKLLGLRGDVMHLLHAADVYINASLWEGLPIAHLEAMMAGLPVVATSVGDAPQVVANGTGLLVPPRRPDALADAILSLLNDPERAATMGHAARERAIRCYSAPVWFDKLVDLYRRAGATI